MDIEKINRRRKNRDSLILISLVRSKEIKIQEKAGYLQSKSFFFYVFLPHCQNLKNLFVRKDLFMSKWSEIRINFFDEEEKKWYVDAWLTDDANEEGAVIAKIDLYTGIVEYLDEDTKTDEYAQKKIREFLKDGELLR